MDVAALAELLHETGEHHDPFEKASPPHDGGTGTPPTWTPVRVGAARTRRPRPPAGTWRRSSTSSRHPA